MGFVGMSFSVPPMVSQIGALAMIVTRISFCMVQCISNLVKK